MVHLDGLAVASSLAAPLISWHSLAQLGICNLSEGAALCNICTDTKIFKSRLVSNALTQNESSHVAASSKDWRQAVHVPFSAHAVAFGLLQDTLEAVKANYKDVLTDEHL